MTQIDKKQLFQTSGRKTGRTIYYSYYTPIALVNGRDVIVSDRKYSTTTSRHQNRIKELHPYNLFITVPHKVFKQMMQDEEMNLGWA